MERGKEMRRGRGERREGKSLERGANGRRKEGERVCVSGNFAV